MPTSQRSRTKQNIGRLQNADRRPDDAPRRDRASWYVREQREHQRTMNSSAPGPKISADITVYQAASGTDQSDCCCYTEHTRPLTCPSRTYIKQVIEAESQYTMESDDDSVPDREVVDVENTTAG